MAFNPRPTTSTVFLRKAILDRAEKGEYSITFQSEVRNSELGSFSPNGGERACSDKLTDFSARERGRPGQSAGVLSQKFVYRAFLRLQGFSQPRPGSVRRRIAQGENPGLYSPHPVPRLRDTPLPRGPPPACGLKPFGGRRPEGCGPQGDGERGSG